MKTIAMVSTPSLADSATIREIAEGRNLRIKEVLCEECGGQGADGLFYCNWLVGREISFVVGGWSSQLDSRPS
jgi:hypothetical protein